MTILIQSRPSGGAQLLRQAINAEGIRCLRRRHDSTRTLRRSSFLVNWGCSGGFETGLNRPTRVASAINKLTSFNSLWNGGVRVPEYMNAAEQRACGDDLEGIWLARHSLSGSGGEGITVVRPGDVFPDAPLYVQYIPKLVEFRVHVFRNLNGGGYDTLTRQKLRESDAEQDRDQRLIRNRENGWVFAHVRDEDGARKAEAEATKAITALGLDFGAVDVIIGRDDGLAYVLEVNTAPGLEAQATLEFYKAGIINAYNNWRNV